MSKKKIYTQIIKPVFDRIGAMILIVISSPMMIIILIILYISNNGKVIFIQPRIGYNGKSFDILKFRTMRVNGSGTFLFGGWIRKLSMDELPQLFNVLKGEMSLVGPRPLLLEYLDHYTDIEKSRHHVMPGITGWAQVRGRNSSSWENRMIDDIYYVENVSMWLDCQILFKTLFQVFLFNQADFNRGKEETFIDYAKKR